MLCIVEHCCIMPVSTQDTTQSAVVCRHGLANAACCPGQSRVSKTCISQRQSHQDTAKYDHLVLTGKRGLTCPCFKDV